ncbi:hypothetical protein A5784_01045 [Mycobacterium sp. 852013-50091_SCH5140682]|uniref:DUF2933 domain-containing protein n=1 Tax=Mycobacterium sp. 852013-50091_SCH5140682 TaxID=1834109 RepID=UPI0007EBE059|nr:DUF2933 domain-containing protein [Mycobacterium sp. 852013-50091_SCH5140682]OBC08046.1 hypothetical protein A5784_01045 [Mycobacterium sp. 852013-50091_SCH5140682]
MKRQHLAWYALALAAIIVGVLAGGGRASTVLLALVVLACPVMMMAMMSGHGGQTHDSGTDQPHNSTRPS